MDGVESGGFWLIVKFTLTIEKETSMEERLPNTQMLDVWAGCESKQGEAVNILNIPELEGSHASFQRQKIDGQSYQIKTAGHILYIKRKTSLSPSKVTHKGHGTLWNLWPKLFPSATRHRGPGCDKLRREVHLKKRQPENDTRGLKGNVENIYQKDITKIYCIHVPQI